MGRNFSKDDFKKGKNEIKTDPTKGTTNNLADLSVLWNNALNAEPSDKKEAWGEAQRLKIIESNLKNREKNKKLNQESEKKIDAYLAKVKKEELAKKAKEERNKAEEHLFNIELKKGSKAEVKIGDEFLFEGKKFILINAKMEEGKLFARAMNEKNKRDIIKFDAKELQSGFKSKKIKFFDETIDRSPKQTAPKKNIAGSPSNWKQELDDFYKNMPKNDPEKVAKYLEYWEKQSIEGTAPSWYQKFKKEQNTPVPKGEIGAGQVRYLVNEKLAKLEKLGMGEKELSALKDKDGKPRIIKNSEIDRIIFLGEKIDEMEEKIRKDKVSLYALEEKLDELARINKKTTSPEKIELQRKIVEAKQKNIRKNEEKIEKFQEEFEAQVGKRKPSTIGNEPKFRPKYTAEEIMEQISDGVDDKIDTLKTKTLTKIDALDQKTTAKLDRKDVAVEEQEENEKVIEDKKEEEKIEEQKKTGEGEAKKSTETEKIYGRKDLKNDLQKEVEKMLAHRELADKKPKILNLNLEKFGNALNLKINIQARVIGANLPITISTKIKMVERSIYLEEPLITTGNSIDDWLVKKGTKESVGKFKDKIRLLLETKIKGEGKWEAMLEEIGKKEEAPAVVIQKTQEEKEEKGLKKLKKRIRELEELVKNKLSGE